MIWTCYTPTPDERPVCQACQALDGQPDGTGWSSALPPNYNVTHLAVTGQYPSPAGPPPLHPNCRCTLT